MTVLPVFWNPPGIIMTTMRMKGDMQDPRIWERWRSQHPPLVCTGRDGYCAIWSMTMRTQSLALPDRARRPSGPPDIHSHSHSCTSPTTPTPTPFGRKYPHSWIHSMFLFWPHYTVAFLKQCVYIFFYNLAQKSCNRKKASQRSASGRSLRMGTKKSMLLLFVLWNIHTILPPRRPTIYKYLYILK